MKKNLKLSLVCAVLFSGMSTYAIGGNGDLNVQVLQQGKNGKLITFALNQVKKANLSIYDKDGILLYSETATGKDGILRTFSLEQFPEGTYFLEVEDNVKKVRHEITVTNYVSVLSRKALSAVYKTDAAKNSSVAAR